MVVALASGGFSAQTAYVANDLAPADRLSNQIHELGHQLRWATGNSDWQDEQWGKRMQNCYNQQKTQAPGGKQ